MRLFITSYQKSGTHQIMPMVNDRTTELPQIVENRGYGFSKVPDMYGGPRAPWEGPSPETIAGLRSFPSRAFAHLAYHEAYEQAVQFQPTKIIFNVRDPRDVVIAEFENIRRHRAEMREGWAFLDMPVSEADGEQVRLMDRKDPLADLITIAAHRWPLWLGWIGRPNVKLVHYEDLRLHPTETVHEIAEWLPPHLPPSETFMIANLHPKRRNPTFRKGAVGEWHKYFNKAQTALADELLGPIIAALGYPPKGYHVEESG